MSDPELPVVDIGVNFRNDYASLPEHFFHFVLPIPVKQPKLLFWNEALSSELGFNAKKLVETGPQNIFSGNMLPRGSRPLAQAYAGHQFGHFVPQLGDGRVVLLGEVVDQKGKVQGIQLKGSGQTPFSRRGDGRSALGPAMREYIVSEAMHALGIPTTRSLALVSTGESVFRERILPGGISTRVSSSYVRVGTFEYFAARSDLESVKILADYVIERNYPYVRDKGNKYLALYKAVCVAQAELIAQWIGVGFIHGVMNTDNMALSGETIDYGPCAFMEAYDPKTLFSSIDRNERYAFDQQGHMAHWNLARLGECLIPLIDHESQKAEELASEVLSQFSEIFDSAQHRTMRQKIGFFLGEGNGAKRVEEFLELMRQHAVDYTLGFRYLCDALEEKSTPQRLHDFFNSDPQWPKWLEAWRKEIKEQPLLLGDIAEKMRLRNPAFIPRNHRVEQAIEAAYEAMNFEPMKKLIKILATPYAEQENEKKYMEPANPEEQVLQTFCGT